MNCRVRMKCEHWSVWLSTNSAHPGGLSKPAELWIGEQGAAKVRSYFDTFEPHPAKPALPRRASIAPEVALPFAFHSNPTVRTRDIKLKGDNRAFWRGWCQKIPSVRTPPGTRLRTFHKVDCSLQYGATPRTPREVRQRQLALESTLEGSTVLLRCLERSPGTFGVLHCPRIKRGLKVSTNDVATVTVVTSRACRAR